MHAASLTLSVVVVATLAVACTAPPRAPEADDGATTESTEPPTAMDTADREDRPITLTPVFQDPDLELAAYPLAQRGAFISRARRRLESLDQDLAVLAVRVEAAQEPLRTTTRPRLQALRLHLIRLHDQLDGVRDADAHDAFALRSAFHTACRDLAFKIRTASAWFTDGARP